MAFFRSIWRGNSKHKKLSDEWILESNEEPEMKMDLPTDGVTFLVKYLGSTLIETPSNEMATAEAIKTIITMAKASGKKLQRVALCVNMNGIKTMDLGTRDIHLDVSIYRISYCSADAHHDHVFAFIATNSNETMECHAFLCPKRKTTQAVTLTMAQSFNTAYQLWQLEEENSRLHPALARAMDHHTSGCSSKLRVNNTGGNSENENENEKNLLVDFSSSNGNSWVSFEDDRLQNVNSNFARLTNSSTSSSHNFNILSNSHCNSDLKNWGDRSSMDLLCQ